jgi:triosephosphate isomerase (TIM)
MRTPIIAGNWKMFKTVHETVPYVKQLRALVSNARDVEIVIAPPFTSLNVAAEAARGSNLSVAAQNIHWEREGPFTGEVSAAMVREAGADYVIIGHSERRTLFGETDLDVNRKLRAALSAPLTPIVCIGETLDQREANQTLEVLDRQLKEGLDNVTGAQAAELVLAYEPVWAIGTAHAATTEQAVAVHRAIRARIAAGWTTEAAEHMRILYGGSVTPQNAASLLSESDIDGALVGGACLKTESFATIVLAATNRPLH